jgi:hypothetical protein
MITMEKPMWKVPAICSSMLLLSLVGCGGTGENRATWIQNPSVEIEKLAEEVHISEESSVRECMKREGYKYFPKPYPKFVVTVAGPRAGDDERQYLKEHGTGMIDAAFAAAPSIPADKNTSYELTLDPATRRSYRVALWGPEGNRTYEASPQGGVIKSVDNQSTKTTSGGGCRQRSAEKLARKLDVLSKRRSLVSDMNGFIRAAETSSEATLLEKNWSACMAKLGFRFVSQGEMLQALQKGLTNSRRSPVDLQSLKDLDRSVAVANFDCYQSRERLSIRSRATAQFISQNEYRIRKAS